MRTHTVHGGDGVALHVQEAGSGRPVVFVHGLSQSTMSWRQQFASDLTGEFRLVAFDNRGHGESEKPQDAYGDSALWAQDVNAVVTELGLDDVVLVGWSYGGVVALDYLATFGTDRVAGLNFVGGVSALGSETATARLGQAYVDLVSGFVSTDAEASVETMRQFVDLCVFENLSPTDRYSMLGYNVVVPPHVRDSLRDRVVSHDDTLASLDVPVLVTHGEEDAVVRPDAARTYAELVDREVSWYADTGHSPFWERPARFNRELRAFACGL